MYIRNEQQLIQQMMPVIKECINNVADYILGKIVDYIQQDVYDKEKPHVYQRSYEFINSWIKEVEQQGNSKKVVAEIFSDYERMEYEPTLYRHGSPESGDFRQMMAQAIEEGLGYKYFPKIRNDGTWNPAARKRPFFQDTVKHLEGSGTLERILKTAFKEKGLILEKK